MPKEFEYYRIEFKVKKKNSLLQLYCGLSENLLIII